MPLKEISRKNLLKAVFGRAISAYILLAVIFRFSVDFPKAAQERLHYLLGIFYNGFYKNYEDGIVYFDHLTRVEPHKAVNFANIGECYYQLGNFEKALEYYQKALRLEPENKRFKYQFDRASQKLDKSRP